MSRLKRTPPGRSELAKRAEKGPEFDNGDDQEFEVEAIRDSEVYARESRLGLFESLEIRSSWLSCCFETEIVPLHNFLKFRERSTDRPITVQQR